ncbi:cytochrome P450 [Phyllosticta citribraziliensis]|uniref:Cytochrome P450 n=1 Tax=Phyllosticta citribraziliensis TaxID=989973 RepID=A0ABR1L8S9_9PEZI
MLWILLVAVALAALYLQHRKLTATKRLLDDLPWVGLDRNQWFARGRAHLREATKSWELLLEGYEKWSKQDKTFVIPHLSFRPEAILAQSHIPWLMKQGEEILSTKPAQVSLTELEWLAPPEIHENALHEEVIRKDLTRHLGMLTEDINKAVIESIDLIWGMDPEWRQINAVETIYEIIIRISNAIFLGDPVYQQDFYRDRVRGFANAFIFSVTSIKSLLPDILRPIIAPILAFPAKYCMNKCHQFLGPVIEERLAVLRRKQLDPANKEPEREDFIQWMTRSAFSQPSGREADSKLICTRIILMETTAIHTSTSTVANTLIDLVSSPPEHQYLEGIRSQSLQIFRQDGHRWTQAGIRRLNRADSAIRESLRYSGFAARGAKRQVTAPGGVTLPDGTHLPQHAWLSIPVAAIHFDERFYPDPRRYDAFRFSDAREEMVEALRRRPGGQAELYEILQERRLSVSTTSDAFVPFGHGRHSCPGRFFAAQMLKLLIAYITIHYDIERLPERPKSAALSDFSAPPQSCKFKIRRRTKAEIDADVDEETPV